jgi:hypothetical protein
MIIRSTSIHSMVLDIWIFHYVGRGGG